MTRFTPAPRSDWPSDFLDLVESYRSNVKGTTPQANRQSGNNLFGTFVQHPALTDAFLTLNGHLMSNTTLPIRTRELVILRVAFLRRSEYEWAQHEILAERAGITADEIARISANPDSEEFVPFERALLSSVDELLDDGDVSNASWAILSENLSAQQLMDLVFTIGCYSMLAMGIRSFGIQPEEGLTPNLPVNW